MTKKRLRGKTRQQSAAVPYRFATDGGLELLLITTRETGRWLVPKGWPIKKLTPAETALREAYEEAGVRGEAGPSVGSFRYLKALRSGRTQLCEVEVFPLEVAKELSDWPEKTQRERRWFPFKAAIDALGDDALRELLGSFPAAVGAGTGDDAASGLPARTRAG